MPVLAIRTAEGIVITEFEFKGITYVRELYENGPVRRSKVYRKPEPEPAPPPVFMPTDPVEKIIYRALIAAEVPFTNDPRLTNDLDFKLLTEPPIYIECKQFKLAPDRPAKDVIAIQGIEAAHFFASLIR